MLPPVIEKVEVPVVQPLPAKCFEVPDLVLATGASAADVMQAQNVILQQLVLQLAICRQKVVLE